jgi:hypothetical protein
VGGSLTKFFGGISLTGYLISTLSTLVLGLGITTGFLNHANGELREELAVSENSILMLLEANSQNRVSIDELERNVLECTNKRKQAEQSAREAKLELSLRTQDASHRSAGRKDEIAKIVDDCNCVVPARTARLLHDAACSANRDTDCP